MDHIKTLYQTRQYNYGTLPLRKAIFDHLSREGGLRSIYKGLGATLLRCTPQHAVVFVCYEEVKKAMQRQRGEQNEEESEEDDMIRIQLPEMLKTNKFDREFNLMR